RSRPPAERRRWDAPSAGPRAAPMVESAPPDTPARSTPRRLRAPVFRCACRRARRGDGRREACMFTGIIEAVGTLDRREARGGDARLRIAVGSLPFADTALGESIAVNGTCLTVVAFDAAPFEADASNETLALTTLGALAEGAPVNLERAMRASDRL